MFFDECDEVFLEATGPNKESNNQIMSRFKQYLNQWREEPGVMVFCCPNKLPEELKESGIKINYVYNEVYKLLSSINDNRKLINKCIVIFVKK